MSTRLLLLLQFLSLSSYSCNARDLRAFSNDPTRVGAVWFTATWILKTPCNYPKPIWLSVPCRMWKVSTIIKLRLGPNQGSPCLVYSSRNNINPWKPMEEWEVQALKTQVIQKLFFQGIWRVQEEQFQVQLKSSLLFPTFVKLTVHIYYSDLKCSLTQTSKQNI